MRIIAHTPDLYCLLCTSFSLCLNVFCIPCLLTHVIWNLSLLSTINKREGLTSFLQRFDIRRCWDILRERHTCLDWSLRGNGRYRLCWSIYDYFTLWWLL